MSAAQLPGAVDIVEVGARDGLQNEDVVLSTDDKVELIRRLVAGGLRRLETASFVHPGLVPQMSDAEQVMTSLGDSPEGVSWIGLVLNRRGLDRALRTTVDEINFVVGASESFNNANGGAAVDDTMRSIEQMVPEAAGGGRRTTLTISVAFGCPYEGEVPIGAVTRLAARAEAAGVSEIALGDTIGVATPGDVVARVDAVRAAVGGIPLRCHFHDTRNTGVANVYAALTTGVDILDASVGGAGGCPFAPNATGNVPTEDVVYTLDRMGIATGVDIDAVADTGRWLGLRLNRNLPSAIARAGGFPAGAAL